MADHQHARRKLTARLVQRMSANPRGRLPFLLTARRG